ncbi:MAG TPA: hypothetical protein VGM23_17135 [Armatimonadota bacterium]
MINNVDSNSALAMYGSTSSARRIAAGALAENSGNTAGDTLEISQTGSLLSKSALKLPNWQSVKELKNDFSALLDKTLKAAGIDSTPPFTITQTDEGVFTVTGDNPKAAQVQDILNKNDDLKMLHHNMQAIASHIPGIEASLQFQREYAAAGSAAVQAVVAKYSSLFAGNTTNHSFTTIYSAEGATLQMDGKTVA